MRKRRTPQCRSGKQRFGACSRPLREIWSFPAFCGRRAHVALGLHQHLHFQRKVVTCPPNHFVGVEFKINGQNPLRLEPGQREMSQECHHYRVRVGDDREQVAKGWLEIQRSIPRRSCRWRGRTAAMAKAAVVKTLPIGFVSCC